MKPISGLASLMKPNEDWVIIDAEGNRVGIGIEPDWAPAVLLVHSVSDAVKRLSGDRVVESLQRKYLLMVEAFVLNRSVVEELGNVELTPRELFDAVRELGLSWEVSARPASSNSSSP